VHFHCEAVETFRAVEGEAGDASLRLEVDRSVGHGRFVSDSDAKSQGASVNADETAREVAFAMLAREGTGPAWGIEIEEAREGYSRIRMRLRADMLNGHGTAHGGMVFALADTAFAYACNSRNVRTVAAQATMIFLDGADENEILVAEAKEQALVGRSGAYNVSVRTSEGRPVAEFQGLSRSVGGPFIEAGDQQP
jgi:acyl-CoA thioesterase